jgi:hypothetical protein
MISTRMALLRQAQEYFHQLLLGVVKWDDVKVDKAIPIPAVRGNRDQGKVKDLVIAHFGGFRMELMGPFESEDWPMGKLKVTHGNISVHGPLDARTWDMIADFIKREKQGADHGTESSTAAADAPARDDWGR